MHVDTKQAKIVLQAYRPRVDDADPQFAEALQLARRDTELSQWLADHCASYEAIRAKLRQTPVPKQLREQILATRPQRSLVAWWARPAFVAAAVAVAVLLNLVMYFGYWYRPAVTVQRDFNTYLQAMTSFAAGGYKMDVKTDDAAQIRQFLASRYSPTEFDVPKGLNAWHTEGCHVLDWNGGKVSLVCYEKEAEKAEDKGSYVWFFIANRAAVPDAPVSESPQFARASGLATASWSRGDKTYVLATRGEQADLEKLL